jgi:electron transport complex protein RnfG
MSDIQIRKGEVGSPKNDSILSILKLGLTLALFSAVACVALAFVYAGTETRIAANQTAKLNDGLKTLFANASFKDIDVKSLSSSSPAVTFTAAYAVEVNGADSGIVIQAETQGFQDVLIALVGVNKDGSIKGIQILQDKDTPGLGAKAVEPAFYGQYTGMKADGSIKVAKDGGKVVAITAATITSRAVSLLVNAAGSAGVQYLGGK